MAGMRGYALSRTRARGLDTTLPCRRSSAVAACAAVHSRALTILGCPSQRGARRGAQEERVGGRQQRLGDGHARPCLRQVARGALHTLTGSSAALQRHSRSRRLSQSVTDDSDMARLVRSHNGTFDSADLFHLQESAEAEQAHERRKLQTERAAFGALRAREAEREADERAQRLVRAAAAAAVTISAAGSKPRAQPSVMVKRAAAQPVPAEDQQRKRAHAAPQCAALAGLAAYSDSEEDS